MIEYLNKKIKTQKNILSEEFDNKYYNGEYLFYNRSRKKWMEDVIYFNKELLNKGVNTKKFGYDVIKV